MLSERTRDPAALPRLALTLLALVLLWPGLRLSELDIPGLFSGDNASTMANFLAGFWPPAALASASAWLALYIASPSFMEASARALVFSLIASASLPSSTPLRSASAVSMAVFSSAPTLSP